jgi:hypothetical protein
MADINSIIDQLSPEELDLLNNDPQMLAAFKAKHMIGQPTTADIQNNAESIEPGIYGETNPTGQKILQNLGAVAGGYGVGQLAGMGASKVLPSLVSGVKGAVAKGAAKVGDLFAPSVETADTALMDALAKKGLKDVDPIIFNPSERDAIVNYAKTVKKLADADKLDPIKLQEARATIKDVLDNKLIAKASPTGQTVSQAKDAATTSLKRKVPDVGEQLDTLKRAYEAEGTKTAAKNIAKKAIIAGLGYAGVKNILGGNH